LGRKNQPMPNSSWNRIKNYVNTIENESLVTRKMLIHNLPNVPHTSIDIYRKLLTDINVLTYIKLGTYKKIQNIPSTMTTTEIIKFLNLRKWRRWFTPLDLFLDETRNSKKII
jgi:hypothetical protein